MATKTLGVKYQVVGFENAKNSIEQLRKGIRLSLKENIENINATRKLDLSVKKRKPSQQLQRTKRTSRAPSETPMRGQAPDDVTSRTAEMPGVSPGIASSFSFNKQKSLYKLQGQIIAQELKGATQPTERTYRASSLRSDVSSSKIQPGDTFLDNYKKVFEKIQQKDYKGAALQWASKPFNTILEGYYEGIGNIFANKIADGLFNFSTDSRGVSSSKEILVKVRQESIRDIVRGIDISLKGNLNFKEKSNSSEKNALSLVTAPVKSLFSRIASINTGYFQAIGQHFGTEFATGLSEVLEEELDISQKRKGRIFGKSISFVAQDGMDNLDEKFNTLKYSIAELSSETEQVNFEKINKFITALLGIPSSLADSYLTGFRRASVEEEAVRKVDPTAATFNEEIDDINNYDEVVIAASGFVGKQGTEGRRQAEKLQELNQDEKTLILSSDTPFSDVMFEAKDAASGAAWGVNALANAAKINLKGFNPDSIALVNKVLALKNKNPEIKIKLVGHSAGGFVTEEAQYLLELLKIKGVSTVTAGTPNLKGNLKAKNITRIFSENDPLNALHDVTGVLDFNNKDTEYTNEVKGHSFDDYLTSDSVKKAIFGQKYQSDRSTPPNIQEPENLDDILKDAIYTAGDAIATVLETEGTTEEKADAAREVIMETITKYDEKINSEIAKSRASIESFQNNFADPQPLIKLVDNKLNKFFSLILQLITAKIDFSLRQYRQLALKDVALPKVYQRAQEILAQNRPRSGARVTDETKQFFAVTGGYAGARGLSGARIASDIRSQVPDAYVIHVPNRNSDPFNRPDPLNSISRPNIRGYNPDAVEIAAQALAAYLKNQQVEIKILGESGGGYPAEEAVYLLELLGVPNVSGMGVGNPDFIGGVKAENFTRLLSPDEHLGKEVHDFWARYYLADVSSPNQNLANIQGHPYEYYKNTPQLQDFLFGQIGKTSKGRANKINKVSQDFLSLANSPMLPAQKNDLKNAAIANLTTIQRRIQQATGKARQDLLIAEQNFKDFLELIEPGSERIENYRSILQRGRQEIDRRIDTPNKQQVQEELEIIQQDIATHRNNYADLNNTSEANKYQAIDRELEKLQAEIDEIIADIAQTPAKERKKIVKKYKQYLQSKTVFAQEDLDFFVEERRSDYQNLPSNDKAQYVRYIQNSLRSRVQDYRTAIRQNNLVLAKAIADSLLGQVQLVKKVYQDISNNLPDDNALKKVIQGNQAYLTSVQTEIIEGQPNSRGRIAQGLPDILDRQISLAQEGQNVVSGFIETILAELDSVQEAGEEIGDAVAEGTQDSLDSHSPSRRFIQIARDVIAGFRQGIEEEGVADIGEQLGDGIVDSVTRPLKELENKYPILGKIKKAIIPIVGIFLGGMGLSVAISALSRFNEELFQAAMKAETLNRAIMVVSRNTNEGAKNLKFISSSAQQLGIDLNTAKAAYSSFIGAAKDTPLEGVQIEQVFESFAETAALRGLSQEATDRLFTALSQIIAKRKLSLEEVRSQIGDIAGMGDFINLVAQSQGVSVPQVEQMMSSGQVGLDALPKIAAVLKAQNAMVKSTETAQTLQTKYNNSLTVFKETLGSIFAPLNKIILQIKAFALEEITNKIKDLVTILSQLVLTTLFIILKDVKIIPVIINAVKFAVEGLVAAVAKIWGVRVAILQFLGAWLLVATAIKTVTNLFDIAKNQFPEAKKDIDSLTKGINAFNDALKEASNSGKEFNNNLPKSNKDLRFNEGLFGQSWLNLDTLARKPINWVLDLFGVQEPETRTVNRPGPLDNQEQFDNQGWIDAVRTLISKRLVTMAEKRQNDFIVNAGDYQFKSNQVMMDTYKASTSAEKITEYDAQIAEIQSARLSLLPSQTEELKASLEAERKIQEERDKELKILTQQQQNLQLVIDSANRRSEELEQLRLEGGITEANYNAQKVLIEQTKADAESNLKDVNDIIGKLPKQLSEFNRQLKNASLRVSGFMENRDRANNQERTQIIQQGLNQGKGDTVIQLELESQSRGDIEARISNLQSEIAKQEKLLGSAALDTAMQRLEEAARSKGGLTTDVIKEMLEQERDGSEKEALSGALAVREWQTQLYQYQEQLAQSMQQSRSSMIDFNRTIQDYFFNLIQQIKEAQLEAKTLLSQILGSKIKNKLKAALIPGSDSFVNGLIEGIQGILDQAQTLIEQTLGLEGNKIQLESSNYSLDKEMQDFIKSVSGATDALSQFRKSLGVVDGGGDSSNNQPIGNNSSVVDSLRRAIIGKESAGKFNAVNPDSGALGYGQVMPANVPSWTKAALGKSLSASEFLNNPDAQIKTINHKLNQYLAKELKATGNNLDIAVRRVASTWYSGQPGLYNNTRPQYYNGGSYPSINDYTADILTRFKAEGQLNGRIQDLNTAPVNPLSASVQEAIALNNQLKADKNFNASLQQQKNAQDKIGFDIQLQQQLQQQERQFISNQRESARTLFGISDRAFEFGISGKMQTANTEFEQGIRSLVGQFRDYKLELEQTKQTYQDTVDGLIKSSQTLPNAIAATKEKIQMFLNAGNNEAASVARGEVEFLESTLDQIEKAIPYYQQVLSGIEAQQERLPDLEKKAIAFYRRQGEIKLDAERISKNSAIAQLKVNIANERGTNELRRQNDLLAEQWRLSSEINRIRSEEGDTPYADELVRLQEEQSKINVENINRSAYDRDLAYEQKLLDFDAGVKNARGGLLSGFGDTLGGNKLQREAAIAQENFRFYKELVDLRREYSADPEKLDILINKATELNQINLEQIKQQFKGLRDTLIDLGRTNLGSFFESAMEGIFNRGEKQLELKEQELQYREELIDAENKYQDNSSGLDFARDRIKKLNEEKLDKIRNELNLFNTVVNAARQAVINLLKEIARMAAQKLAAKIIGTVFSSFSSGVSAGSGATTSMNFDGGVSTFSASEGITVPNYDKGGIVNKAQSLFSSEAFQKAKAARDNTKGGFFKKAVSFFSTLKNSKNRAVPTSYSNYLRSTSPAIEDAFTREGSKGVLGVFTPGEEILSIKTGEAGRYQALKQKLGLDPLKRIFAGNFATGGTVDIEKNLLSQLPSISTPVSLTGIGNQKSNIPTSVQNITNFSATVVTPNADSFRASSYQTQQDIAEALLRARR